MGYATWIGLSDGDGTFSTVSGTNFIPSEIGFQAGDDSNRRDRVVVSDFNGDGLTDIFCLGENRWLGLSDADGTFTFTSGTACLSDDIYVTTGSEVEKKEPMLSADFNGDGLMDILVMYGSCAQVALSKGDGSFDVPVEVSFSSSFSVYSEEGSAPDLCFSGDFNGDGLSDFCALTDDDMFFGFSNGDGTFTCEGDDSGDFCVNRYQDTSSGARPDIALTGDFNGDGVLDVCGLGSRNWVGVNGNEGTRLETVTQGYQSASLHGVVTEIEYLPLTDPDIYVKGSGAEYPIRDIISSMYVVSDMVKDNGQDGEYRTQYAYRSGRTHMHGRGFLGFQQFISYDYETDICYTETLAHEFPLTGRRLKTETAYIPDPTADPDDADYSQPIKTVDNTWNYDLVDGGTLFAYNPKSVETKWELGNTNDIVSQVTAYNWFDNQETTLDTPNLVQYTNTFPSEITYGNLVKNIIDYGSDLKKTTENGFDDLVTSTNWFLGRLDESTVTHENAQSNIVRSSSFDYYAGTGLLSQEVIEPGDPDFELVTDYYYDGYGNITDKVLTPAGLPARAVLANTYDSKGRFVEESQNALGHSTTLINDPVLGKPLSSTDLNNLTTHWLYDLTGRPVYEQRPDGTTTTNSYIWDDSLTLPFPDDYPVTQEITTCTVEIDEIIYETVTNIIEIGNIVFYPDPEEVPVATNYVTTCVTGLVDVVPQSIYKLYTETDGAPPVTTWFDKQGREIRTKTQSADGRDVYVDTGYNSIAQPILVSEPYFDGDTPVYTYTEYDGLGRPQYITAPDDTVTETVYDGLTRKVIKDSNYRTTGDTPKHQIATSVKNAKGELLSVIDAMSNTVTYAYDPVGNLILTTDPDNNTIEMGYDIRGNKRWQDDPDMGEWTYTYNALDQLMSQTDANGNLIQTAYDVLGRSTARTNWVMTAATSTLELESTAGWFYDGTSEGDKLGGVRLEEHRDSDGELINRKRYAYDDFSRPMLELMNYDDKWYYTALEYDDYSRVEKTHRYWRPKGKEGVGDNLEPQWNTFATINTYNQYGALLEVVDSDSHTWWSADASDYDQYGRLTGYEYGNGLATTNAYDQLTGRLESTAIRNTHYPPISSATTG
jgi:YD repeat-containing protein